MQASTMHDDEARQSGGDRSPLRVRAPRVGFDEVPRYWFAKSAVASHLVNGVNLLFPAGERFFIRAVRHYLPEVEARDPALAVQVRGFFGQEGRHAYAHERFFDALREQGYPIDTMLERYEHVAYDLIEKNAPPPLRLAVTVALEHFTAILAEEALTMGLLENADPALRRLLSWHAVEELEHKAVAFDVLRLVNPSYALRMSGMALASTTLGAFWANATRQLLAIDGVSIADAARELKQLRRDGEHAGMSRIGEPIVKRVFLAGIREYARRGFHPNDKDHRPLIRSTLERLEAEGVVDGTPALA